MSAEVTDPKEDAKQALGMMAKVHQALADGDAPSAAQALEAAYRILGPLAHDPVHPVWEEIGINVALEIELLKLRVSDILSSLKPFQKAVKTSARKEVRKVELTEEEKSKLGFLRHLVQTGRVTEFPSGKPQ